MQKENGNNRVHTGDQSGKTEFPIMSLLPVGRENSISTTDLVRLTGCVSVRELQQRIAECKQLLVDYEFKNPNLGTYYLSWPFPFLDPQNALINDLLCILTGNDSGGMDG